MQILPRSPRPDSDQKHRTKGLLTISLLCTLLGLCATTPTTTNAQAPVPTGYFGLTVGNSEITPAPVVQYGTTRSWDTWPHPDWSDANPSQGVYYFAPLASYIAANPGRDMIYTLGRTPQWASSQPNAPGPYGPGQCAPPTNLSDWDNYVTAVATAAAGKIKYWELWNEPQNPNYYCGDIPMMVAMAQDANRIIKSIDPSALILSPAVTSAAGPAWLASFLSQGGAATVDIIAFHGYWSTTAEGIQTVVANYRTVMAANGVSQLPMWDTEASDGVAQGEFVSKYYLLQWSLGVSRFLWYAYDGAPEWGQLWNPTTGVASAAATAYAQTYNWMVGATLTTPCSEDATGVWTCGLSRAGYNATATWNSTATVTVSVPAQFVDYRDLTGAVYPITNGTVSVGNQPILIEGVATAVPTLSFAPIATPTYGNAFTVSATSASTGAVTYSVASGPATVSGSTVTPTGIGTVVLSATQAPSSYYAASAATTTSFTAAPAPPVLTFATIAPQTFGSPFTVSATSASTGAVTYSAVSGQATVSGSTVTPTVTGTIVLTASQAASGNYAAGTASTSFTAGVAVPTISFQAIASPTYGRVFPARVVSPSSGWVTYTVASGQATISGYEVTPTGIGTLVLSASQAASGNYAAGTASTTVTVAAAVPVLSFATVPSQTYGNAPFNVSATSPSTGAITYAVASGAATISGSTVSVTGTGTVWLSASQAANGNYLAATATTKFTVASEVPTLSFAAIASQTYGKAFTVKASSASSGYVTYTVVSGPATVSGYTVTPTGAGTVVLNASQAASSDYTATTATTSVTIAPAAPTLSFATVGPQVYGSVVPVSATSASSGAVTYAVTSGPATISGSSVSLTGTGTVWLSANQVASGNYLAATATTKFTVATEVPTLTFAAIGAQTYGVNLAVRATSASSGYVAYAVVSGPATVSGYTVTFTGTGTVVLNASQTASGNYAAATATTSFAVAAKAATLAFAAIAPQTYGNAAFAVSATSASSGAVTYAVTSGPATISGSTVTLTGAGSVVLSATQAAAGSYAAATATTSFTVAAEVPTLTFAAIASQTYGNAAFTVSATSASSGAVTYAVVSGPATISGSTVTLTGTGSVVLSAKQAVSGNYASATATTSFTVAATGAALSATAAARLLDQSSFGPTTAAIAQVQSAGIDGYLNAQFAAPASTLAQFNTASPPASCTATTLYNCVQSEWWNAILYGPDQLRQRVAFAFSEMFVVSTESDNTLALPQFQNVLVNDAFGNFSTLLKDVAISPAMGAYLNMLDSGIPPAGKIPNENFARENMQLFTIGLDLLNADGSLQLDGNGNPIPAYTEAQVQAFARAYTGWTYANSTGGSSTNFPNLTPNYTVPMALVESEHDTAAKILLNNIVLPGGQNGQEDLTGAITNLFNHPNTGPFVCKQLIQHLVTSTPSPAYVARVAAVFANDGAGVRGDLKSVIRAILTDEEARAGDTSESVDGGHLREPILFVSGMVRGLGISNTSVGGSDRSLSVEAAKLSQNPYSANSVFNFFPADYILPGTSLNAPEFGLENTAQVILRLSLADRLVGNYLQDFNDNLSATSTFGTLAANPANLVSALSTLFMHSQMPSDMNSAIISAITPLTSNAQRARVAVYLVVTSPQYNVIH